MFNVNVVKSGRALKFRRQKLCLPRQTRQTLLSCPLKSKELLGLLDLRFGLG